MTSKKITDLRPDSWYQIAQAIRAGQHPEVKHLVIALSRKELVIPHEVDGEIQLYLAKLLNTKSPDRLDLPGPKIDRRGRPKNSEWVVDAMHLVERVDAWARVYQVRWRVADPKRQALNRVAAERNWGSKDPDKRWEIAEAKYYAALKKLRGFPDLAEWQAEIARHGRTR